MEWGTFSPLHLLTLGLGAALVLGLYFVLRRVKPKAQIAVLFCLSLLGIGAIIFNLLAWNNPWHYLPFHLCSLNAMVLPVAVRNRSKIMGNLLLVWSLGALAALVLNHDMTHTKLSSWTFFFYYFPHLMEFGIPVLMFRLGLVKKDVRCIAPTIGISLAAYTAVHFINLAIIRYAHVDVNYMFSIQPNNPLLALFYRLVPYRYWYMFLIIPILLVYLLGVYAPQLLRRKVKAA